MKRIQIQLWKPVFVLAVGLLLLTLAGRQFAASAVLAGQSGEANESGVQRIVGGEGAERSAWPWMVGLVSADELDALNGQFCGAALVAERWVMTAAHCLFDEEGRRLTAAEVDVIVGRQQLSSSEGERIAVTTLILHPSYDNNSETNEADLALLGLASASSQPPISLISANNHATLAAPGTMATALGWGQRGEEEASTDALHRVNVPIVANNTCNAPQSNDGQVSKNMLCAGYPEGGLDTCYGDSGGPLVVPNAKQDGWLQVGVVSWGDGCALPNKYGVYTRVANFNAWVQEQISTEPSVPPTSTPSDDDGNENGNENNQNNEAESPNEGEDNDGEWYDEGYEDEGWYDEGYEDGGEDGEVSYEWYDEETGEWYECQVGDEFCDIDWGEEYDLPEGN
ncbi:MAG: S1 family peptidase [Ardenticatenaceae bacterium]